jgi:AmmeMemoRadiSam system protein A
MFEFNEDFCRKAAECGHRSFVIMAGALDGIKVRSEVFSHQDVTGVGYGIASFYPEGTDSSRHFLDMYMESLREGLKNKAEKSDEYVRLARASLESYIMYRKKIEVPGDLPDEMLSKTAGAFVSIHKGGSLRGCIGTILATTDCIGEEIIRNAISASTKDPRFPAVTEEELSALDISVDVLGEPEEISSPDELDVKKYGVIVTKGYRRGLLLPDLEGVDTVEDQIAISKYKAGIGQDEEVSLQRFEVIRHH